MLHVCLFPSFVTNQNMTVIPDVTLPEILNCIFQSTPCYNTTNNCMMHLDTSSVGRSYSLQQLHIKCESNTKVNSVLKMNRTVSSTHKCLKSYDVNVRHHSSNNKRKVHNIHYELNMSSWSFFTALYCFSNHSGKVNKLGKCTLVI